MNNGYSIGDLMDAYYESELSDLEEIQPPEFSAKHKRKIRKAFKTFENNGRKYLKNGAKASDYSSAAGAKRHISIRKRAVMALAIIICAALSAAGIVAFSKGFYSTVDVNSIHLFADDTDNCPSTIEKKYRLSVVPEGYEFYRAFTFSRNVRTIYRDAEDTRLNLYQYIKKDFNYLIDTKTYVSIEETFINGHDAVCVDYGSSALVIWNSDDYILILDGEIAKDELLNLANINESKGF